MLGGCVVEGELAEGALADDDGAGDDLQFRTAFPPGYGRYCSVLWPDGSWAVEWGTQDPCADLEKTQPKGFTVERAGRYDLSGLNNVVMRCAQIVWWGRTFDESTMVMAEGYANEFGLTHCTMTVAPAQLPLFDSPFALADLTGSSNGFDFMFDDAEVDVAEFGQPSAVTPVVDFLGRDRSGIAVNNHYGIDYDLPEGKPIYAVADGRVIMSHRRDGDPCGCGSDQEEMMIRHRFADGRADRYAESFVTYYAHFSSRVVDDGDWVSQGDVIGYAGTTGCSGSSHLHLGVKRLTNTASELVDSDFTPIDPDATTCMPEDNSTANIDPYGWWPQQLGFDPWGWTYHDKGAMSIDLWREGQKPPRE